MIVDHIHFLCVCAVPSRVYHERLYQEFNNNRKGSIWLASLNCWSIMFFVSYASMIKTISIPMYIQWDLPERMSKELLNQNNHYGSWMKHLSLMWWPTLRFMFLTDSLYKSLILWKEIVQLIDMFLSLYITQVLHIIFPLNRLYSEIA